MNMSDCAFCSFKDQEVIIHEDDLCFAAISMNPINRYHVLVIPKEHYENLIDLPDELISHLFVATKKLSSAVRKTCSPSAIQHLTDDDIERKGFNLVAHFKIHIIPRFEDDELEIEWGPGRKDLNLEERGRIARQVKNELERSSSPRN